MAGHHGRGPKQIGGSVSVVELSMNSQPITSPAPEKIQNSGKCFPPSRCSRVKQQSRAGHKAGADKQTHKPTFADVRLLLE